MATFNSFAALERQIMKDMQTAAKRSKDRIEMELFMNVNGYYDVLLLRRDTRGQEHC